MIQVYRTKSTQKQEIPLLLAYSLMAFVAGVFLTSFDILVHARFFEIMGYKYMATTYIVGGIIGGFFTFLFSIYFRKIHTKLLNYLTSLFILLCAGTYLVLDYFFEWQLLYYYGMVMLFPINSLVILTLWRFGRKMLWPRQSREIVPKVRIFHLAGLAAGGGITALTLMVLKLNAVSLFCLFALFIYFVSHHLLYYLHKAGNIYSDGKEQFIPVSNSLLLFFTSRYSTYLLIFAILSAAIGFSIHFTFINIAVAGFQNTVGLAKFYGLFLATLIVFTYGVNRFLIRKILFSNDSPYSLVLIPFLLLIITFLTIGGYFFFSNIQPHEHFTLFFLLISITKVGYDSTKYIIQSPSLRTLFQTLDIRYKQFIFPRIEGTAVMLGLFLAGVGMLILTLIPGFRMNYILYWIILLCFGWMFVSIKLIQNYKQAQHKTLNKLRRKRSALPSDSLIEQLQWEILLSTSTIKTRFLLRLLRDNYYLTYNKFIKSLLSHHSAQIRREVYTIIAENKDYTILSDLDKAAKQRDGSEKAQLLELINQLNRELKHSSTPDELQEIIYSGSGEEKQWLAQTSFFVDPTTAEDQLNLLAKDSDRMVQFSAVQSLSLIKPLQFSHSLFSFIYPENYIPSVIDAIANSGNEALDYLEREQLLPDTSDLVKLRIEKIYGKIASSESISNIVSQLTTKDYLVLKHSIQALINNNFQAGEKSKFKVLSFIVRNIAIFTSNLSIYHQLSKKAPKNPITEAFRQEIDKNYNLIFSLLALVYNPRITNTIKELCVNGSPSEINHGIELADLYFDEDLKPVLLPMLEDISLKERLHKLEYFFIQPKYKVDDILSYCLTTDFNHLSIFPRLCAMQQIADYKLNSFENELIFNSYHPIEVLKQTAVRTLEKLHPESINLIDQNSPTLKDRNGNNTNLNIDADNKTIQNFNEIKEIQYFQQFSEDVILQLAIQAKKVQLNVADIVDINTELTTYNLMFLEDNHIKANKNCVISSIDKFIDLELLKEYGATHISFSGESVIWLFETTIVKEILLDHIDFAAAYFTSILKLNITKQ